MAARTSIQVSEPTADMLRKARKQKADGSIETIEEVILRLKKEAHN